MPPQSEAGGDGGVVLGSYMQVSHEHLVGQCENSIRGGFWAVQAVWSHRVCSLGVYLLKVQQKLAQLWEGGVRALTES